MADNFGIGNLIIDGEQIDIDDANSMPVILAALMQLLSSRGSFVLIVGQSHVAHRRGVSLPPVQV